MSEPAPRQLVVTSLRPTGKGRIRARDGRRVEHGLEVIDLAGVEQILDASHAVTIGFAIRWMAQQGRGAMELVDLLDAVEAAMGRDGVEVLSDWEQPPGDLIRPRRHEIAAALNRLRTVEVAPSG